MRTPPPLKPLLLAAALAALAACGDDSENGTVQDAGDTPDGGAPSEADAMTEADAAQDGGLPESKGPLLVVTEREAPDSNLQYLHVLSDWPENGKLNYRAATELGEFVNVRAHDGAVFVYQPEDSTMRKFVVNGALEPELSAMISFAGHGVAGWDPDHIWVSADRAFLVDENSAQIIRWNPKTMRIEGATPIDRALLERDGLKAQLQQGVAADGRAYMAMNWRDWETFEFVPVVALAFFDTTSEEPELTIVEDTRCAPSVGMNVFLDEDDNAYIVGDGALGFDVLASPKKTALPQCVLRLRAGESEFDPDFFVDLQAATGSPGIYTAHPMPEGKLLVYEWAPDVAIADVVDTATSDWYWENPPYFEHAIVDLKSGSSTPVTDLPRAAAQFSITLRVDGVNYVQTYRGDGGVTLFRVAPDATTTQVLETEAGTDVQYVGRL